MRVLVIEDDVMIGKALCQALRDKGNVVDWTKDGLDGGSALSNHAYAVALLDIGLPGCSGLEVLRAARSSGNTTPILVITARDGVEARIAGLDLGADDYIVKPFEIGELLARMRAVMRRRHGGHADRIVRHGELSIDLETHRVAYRGHAQVVGAREFALIRALLERPGAILDRSQLEDRLYGWGEEVESNAVDVLIHYVRRKFGKEVIRNVRGSGWTIDGGER